MWDKIKNILQKEGGKCIVVDKDESVFVVMKMDDYEKLSNVEATINLPEVEKANQDIAEWREEQTTKNELRISPGSKKGLCNGFPLSALNLCQKSSSKSLYTAGQGPR